MPGKSHGQRSLAGCSPWGHKELVVTESLSTIQMDAGEGATLKKKKQLIMDFLGGLVVWISCFYCRRQEFDLLSRSQDPTSLGVQPKQNSNNK